VFDSDGVIGGSEGPMTHSMTGYGQGVGEVEGVVLQAEARSVNHRYLDLRAHLPPTLLALEPQILALAKQRLDRGRVDITVRPDRRSRPLTMVRVDLEAARQYHSALGELAGALELPGAVDLLGLASLKDVLVSEESGDALSVANRALEIAVGTALDQLLQMRQEEGQRLVEDLQRRIATLASLAEQVHERLPEALVEGRDRLEARVRELLARSGGEGLVPDEGRLLTEVALIAERSDATEELVRLQSHLEAMRELLEAAGPVGRKADFLCQELLRELNTLGSKATDMAVTRLMVEMKTELERVREQVQNLE